MPAIKSTIVRLSQTALFPSIRAAFRVLGHAAPGLAAAWALDLFFTPRGRRGSRRIRALLADARRFEVTVRGRRVAAWSWGEGPAVYLVHGWAGVGGQLAAFVPALTARGFRAVAFDAPGHGASEGRRSSIVHFAESLRALAAQEGRPHAVIAHSLGAAAVVRALTQGLELGRAVFIGPTGGPRDWSERFRRQLGVPAHVMTSMRERSERWLGARWEEFDVPVLARGQSAPLLILHDRHDDEVPWSDGEAIARAWPGARLVTTTGLGHRRILRDPRVVGLAVDFVKGEPLPAGPASAHATLEASLFFRDEREAYSASWKMMPSV